VIGWQKGADFATISVIVATERTFEQRLAQRAGNAYNYSYEAVQTYIIFYG